MTKKKKKTSQRSKMNFENEEFIRKMSAASQEEILLTLNLKHFGLTKDEYYKRQEQYGKNELKKQHFNWPLELAKAFFGPFNLILLGIATYYFVSYATYQFGTEDERTIFDVAGAIIILVMVVSSGAISFIQEIRTHSISRRLGSIVKSTTDVIRIKKDSPESLTNLLTVDSDNQLDLIKIGEERDARDLVPGDLIYLSGGDMLPADVRILQSIDLFVNQSSLTGESVPNEKHALNNAKGNNILDFQNICYTGTSVVSGGAIGIVIATANSTYFSTISKTIMEKRPKGSFLEGIKKVTRVLILLMLIMVPIVYLINGGVGFARWDGSGGLKNNPWFTASFFAISVAVGLTPEMLPMIVTTNLANGSARMAKKKVVVKKLDAIQSLGAIDVLATDKTGTLTNDQIEMLDCVTIDKKADPRLLKYLYLNSYLQTGLKNPMDRAVIDMVKSKKLDQKFQAQATKIDEIPFDFNRRKLTIIFDAKDEGTILVTKGSMEEVLKASTQVYYKGKVQTLTPDIERQIKAHYASMNDEGKRLLGVAYKKVNKNKKPFTADDEVDLIFFGFASFLDTPKPSIKKMIKLLNHYGVDLKILTGDNEQVTRAIAKMVHLDIKGLVTGEQIDAATERELREMVEKCNVFVKLNPLQKVRVIQVLKTNGHVVGFMGDGINDAPVLRQADVAISVNNATDIAKDASDIILLEKSLLILENGIVQGRTIFGNILKYIKITTSSNFGNVLSMIVASAWLPFLPMLPIQILLQNLIYDLSQFAIALDRVDESFISQPQRWKANDIIPFALINGPVSSVFDVATFAIAGYAFHIIPDWNNATDAAVKASLMGQFNASWFVVGVITQTIVVQVLRTEKVPFIQSRSPWPINLTIVGIVALAFTIVYTPAGGWINMTSPAPVYAAVVVGIVLTYCCLAQVVKIIYKKIYHKWL